MKRFLSLILLAGITVNGFSQRILSLDSCRNLAIKNNKELRIAQEKINAAHYNKKAAFTNYLPKFDILATYMRTQKEISLLSDEQKTQSAISVLQPEHSCNNNYSRLQHQILYWLRYWNRFKE